VKIACSAAPDSLSCPPNSWSAPHVVRLQKGEKVLPLRLHRNHKLILCEHSLQRSLVLGECLHKGLHLVQKELLRTAARCVGRQGQIFRLLPNNFPIPLPPRLRLNDALLCVLPQCCLERISTCTPHYCVAPPLSKRVATHAAAIAVWRNCSHASYCAILTAPMLAILQY
jgi:hypothetical protein